MIGIISLILLLSIYFPLFYIFIKKRKKKIVRFVLIPLAILFFPIFYLIIYLNIPYYHLESFEGKVIDAITKEPIQGTRVIARYTKSYPSVAGTITYTVDSQEAYTNQDGEFRIPEVSRWFGDKNGNPEGDINVDKNGYARFPSSLSKVVNFIPYQAPSDKHLLIELMPITIELMIRALYSEIDGIRFEAASKLIGKFKATQTVKPLIDALKKGNLFARRTAAYTLGKSIRQYGGSVRNVTKDSAMMALIEALQDKEPTVRVRVIEALGEIKDCLSVRPIIGALRDKDPGVRQRAAKALGDIKDPAALEPLIEAIKDENKDVKKSAIWALRKFDDPRVATPLIADLQDKKSRSRLTTIMALEKSRDPRTVPALIAALEEDDRMVKKEAARALGKIRDPRAVQPLIALLKDNRSDRYARQNAAWALGRIGESSAVEPLILMLKDKDPTIRSSALHSLGDLKNPRSLSPIISALEDDGERVRRSAANVLGKIGDPRAVEPLISALNDEDRFVRENAADALGKIRDPRAVETLIKIAKYDDDGRVRQEAGLSLGVLRQFGTVARLIDELSEGDARTRRRVIVALGYAKDATAVEPLIEELKDRDKNVRKAAVWALERITGKKLGKDPTAWQDWWKNRRSKQKRGQIKSTVLCSQNS